MVQDETQASPADVRIRGRTVEEVAARTLALLVIAVKAEGLEQRIVDRVIKEYGLKGDFTPKELAFLQERAPSQQDCVQFTWRYEAAWVLLWALGYVAELGKPTGTCDVPRAVTFMRERTRAQFIAEAHLRPLAEILDQAVLVYRYQWSIVEARVRGQPPPTGLEPGVTLERYHALNWLVGYPDQAWDEVSTGM